MDTTRGWLSSELEIRKFRKLDFVSDFNYKNEWN